ncbi:hypothetical protein [Gryllotalpicola protaetiae]|uniref:Uncharacterized protein n=1 Tax=Gryllotalpicola protaetiae TaxID=2419771 RepID=A0A387BQL4_9MICO|nr:hypothetical protein [Gryllotalpicola protaetiae]AYG03320.1 hypothetical protein D7I44_07095 [Gryllotalpicola protaetiae]
MVRPDESELRELQSRAYGPDADIHLDPVALIRLRELEGKVGGQVGARPAADAPGPGAPVAPSVPVTPSVSADADEEAPAQASAPIESGALRPLPRRRGALIAAAAIVALVLIGAGALIAHRTQSDPLQTGARQVARLSVDRGYQVPRAIGGDGVKAKGFVDFHGLRAVVVDLPAEGGAADDVFMEIYRDDDITDPDSTEFSGRMWGGNAAGSFPAMVQFEVSSDTPAKLRSVYGGRSLQFVYDKAHREVIVFEGK